MFTGIIETLGRITDIQEEGSNIHFKVESEITPELKVDQSVAHNGVCLTVTKIESSYYWVTAVQETLDKTSLGNWALNQKVNLERCLKYGGRLDGHLVQGHVDLLGTCTKKEERDGSWIFGFSFAPTEVHHVLVEKGSICINGVSLTAFNTQKSGYFEVTIIPYTYEHTQFHTLKEGDSINLEFDILGKYVAKMFPNSQA
ncbi:MAG: riboflavin synthase [Sphingobacteriales bacterium]|jgi:riboflavin synthase